MRTIIIILTILLHVPAAFAQYNQELEKRNGFKDIKLGMIADSVKGVKFKKEFKEKDEFPAKLFAVEDAEYVKIGEVDVNNVEIKSYKNQVYQIHVVTDKDTRLMKALESIYGSPEYDLKAETYFWKSKNLILMFRSFSKNQLEMVYTSYIVLQKMKDDRGKKVQDIADDF